jgi:hypothetical protein
MQHCLLEPKSVHEDAKTSTAQLSPEADRTRGNAVALGVHRIAGFSNERVIGVTALLLVLLTGEGLFGVLGQVVRW